MQLVGAARAHARPDHATARIGPDEVAERFGVPPDKVVDVQALAGDSTDNVPGVPGIGVKTAAELINTYGDLDTLLARAGEIKQPKRRENLIANRRQGARLARAGEAARRRGAGRDDRRLRRARARPREAARLPARAGVQVASSPASKASSPRSGVVRAASEAHGRRRRRAGQAAKARRRAPTSWYATRRLLAGAGSRAAARAGFVAVDTETTSLDPMRASCAASRSPSSRAAACYIPLGAHGARGGQGTLDLGRAGGEGGDGGGACAPVPGQIPLAEALALLKPMLEDPGSSRSATTSSTTCRCSRRYGIAGRADRRHDAAVLRARRRPARPRARGAGRAIARPHHDQVTTT